MISAIIITAIFVLVIAIILTEKVNRAILAMTGAVATYAVLVIVDGEGFFIFADLMFSINDDFVNFKAILLIIGMLLIIQVCQKAGLFQFFAYNIIKSAGLDTKRIMATLCILTMLMASILNNVLTLVILIPLTVMLARILGVDPKPYIVTEAVIANMGATLFSISSIPNILITSTAGITFVEFFLNVGVMSIVVSVVTIGFFLLYYRGKLGVAEKSVEIIKEFDAWSFIHDRGLLYKSVAVLFSVMACFVLIPPDIISPDLIALTGGLFLVLISKLNAEEIISKLDVELVLFLLGIFLITGALEHVGILDLIGTGLLFITGGIPIVTSVVLMWVSAYAGAYLDNISITKVMIPATELMTGGFGAIEAHRTYFSLVFGVGWGDNLSPMGDNVIVLNLSKASNVDVTFKDLFTLGFVTTNFQLAIITVYIAILDFTWLSLVFACIFSVVAALVIAAVWVRAKRQDKA